jgi:hypothetical protein
VWEDGIHAIRVRWDEFWPAVQQKLSNPATDKLWRMWFFAVMLAYHDKHQGNYNYMAQFALDGGFPQWIIDRTKRLATLAGETQIKEGIKWGERESQMLGWIIQHFQDA